MNPQPKVKIDRPNIEAAVTAERLALCDLLDTLDPSDWRAQSLCATWTVHEVVAHLALAAQDTSWDFIKGAVKARGNFDRMNTSMARKQSDRFAPPALVEQLRDAATSTRRAPLSSPLDPLIDILVHGQDIARPLERTHPMTPEPVLPALTYAMNSRWYGGSKRFIEVTLIATDTDWSVGTGGNVARGATGDMLLVATGRPAGLSGLSGPGVEVLAAQLRRA